MGKFSQFLDLRQHSPLKALLIFGGLFLSIGMSISFTVLFLAFLFRLIVDLK